MGKVLRLTDDEAKLLAAWVRTAANRHDAEAEKCSGQWQASSRDHHIRYAAKARALADNLERPSERRDTPPGS